MGKFGIILNDARTTRLMELAEYMNMSPEEVIHLAIDTMHAKITNEE